MSRELRVPFGVLILACPALAQQTTRASVDSAGAEVNGFSLYAAISGDGRYVGFESDAPTLVVGDTNGSTDVFVHDRLTGATLRASVDSSGVEGDNESFGSTPSGDGRFVAFWSWSSNLVPGDTNDLPDVFVHDFQTGATERVSVDSAGAQANGASDFGSFRPSISADGRYVVFDSSATNLVAGDTNGRDDIFLRDRLLGTTERISVDSAGGQSNSDSYGTSVSADGRYVAFISFASNLVSGDSNFVQDVFVRDRQTGTTERVSVATGGAQANNESRDVTSISADGRYVAFLSVASNLVAGDTNATWDVFVRDRVGGTTERVSVATGGTQADDGAGFPAISADGRFVAFVDWATNLVAGDTNGASDIFVRDRDGGTTERVSVDSAGVEGNDVSDHAAISADGRFVAFASIASNLVVGDTNDSLDVFLRDRNVSGFTSVCHPGLAGVISCPCSNPPSGSGRGCDNSAATGGAQLSAGGSAYLATDTLVFTTSGEKPTATSVLLQGTTQIGSGFIYGQGVRCVGGTLKRMYTKTAAGGSITAPDFGAGNPTVSARSATLGNPISPGQSRYYLVYYRDPTVLGGCPSASTFNSTQTGRVDWSL